jgi:hypothetical protein
MLKKIYQVYGSPIFERINFHMQRYLHQAFNEKIRFFSCWVQIVKKHDNGFLSQYITSMKLIFNAISNLWQNINKANKRLKKQVFIARRQKTRNLILMVPHSDWLWTVTTDPVWHFSMSQHEIVKILNFSNLFQHHLPFYYKNTLNLPVSIIVQS